MTLRIAVVTPVYRRVRLTALWWQHIERVRRQWAPDRVDVFVAGDEPEHAVLCAEHGGHWCHEPNVVSDKFNAAWNAALATAPDYLMVLGSDDFLTIPLSAQIQARMHAADVYFGLRSVYCVEPATKRALHIQLAAGWNAHNTMVGTARVMSGRRAAAIGPSPWPPGLMHACDTGFSATIKLRDPRFAQCDYLDDGILPCGVIGVKTTQNIWEMRTLIQRQGMAAASYRSVLAHLPATEREAINALA